jgi:hypothetical protein
MGRILASFPDIGYKELAERLNLHGLHETETSITGKLARGTFAASCSNNDGVLGQILGQAFALKPISHSYQCTIGVLWRSEMDSNLRYL